MPTYTPADLSPEDLQYLQTKGIDIHNLPKQFEGPEESSSTLGAIGKTLRAHAGRNIIGGLGTAGSYALATALAPESGGLSYAIPLISSLIGGSLSAAGGEKGQELIQGPERTKQYEQEAEQARQEHPIAAPLSDIAETGLSSLLKPSFDLPRAARALVTRSPEDLAAAGRVGIGAGSQMAIDTAGSLVHGQLPTISSLGEAAAGGALFTKPMFGHYGMGGASQDLSKRTIGLGEETTQPKVEGPISPFIAKDEQGNHIVDKKGIDEAWLSQNPEPGKKTWQSVNPDTKWSDLDYVERAKIRTAWRGQLGLNSEQRRQALHDQYIKGQSGVENEINALEAGEKPEDLQKQLKENLNQEISQKHEAEIEEQKKTQEVKEETAKEEILQKNLQKQANEQTTQLTSPSPVVLEGEQARQKAEEQSSIKTQLDNTQEQLRQVQEKQAQMLPGQKLEQQKIIQEPVPPQKPIETPNNWLQQNIQSILKSLPKTTLDKIEELAAQRLTASQVAQQLGMDEQTIRLARIGLKIPSQVVGGIGGAQTPNPDFEPWLKSRQTKQRIIAGSKIEQQKIIQKPVPPQKPIETSNPVMSPESANWLNTPKNPVETPTQPVTSKTPIFGQLQEAMQKGQVTGERKGIIAGSKLEQWSDKTISESKGRINIGIDPKLMLAYTIKGAAHIERGLVDFASWSKRMLSEYGEQIKPFLQHLFQESGNYLKKNSIKRADIARYNEIVKQIQENTSKGIFSPIELSREKEAIKNKYGGMPPTLASESGSIINPLANKGKGKQQNAINPKLESQSLQREREGIPNRGNIPENKREVGKAQSSNAGSSSSLQQSKGGKEEGTVGIKGLNNLISQVRSTEGEFKRAPIVADAIHRVHNTLDSLSGHFVNGSLRERNKLSPEGANRIEAAGRWMRENKAYPSVNMFKTHAEVNAFNNELKLLKEQFQWRQKEEEPIIENGKPRMPQRDPFYWPTTTDHQVAQDIKKNINLKQYSDIFLAYHKKSGVDENVAKENLDNWIKGIKGNISNNQVNMQHFNANRIAQGIPLPPELTAKGNHNAETYWRRSVADMSFFKHIEKDPEVMATLGETKDAWFKPIKKIPTEEIISGESHVRTWINKIKGETAGSNFYNEKGWTSLANAIFLGPRTAIHKPTANQIGALTYDTNPYLTAKRIAVGISNFGEGFKHADENGKIRYSAKRGADMFDSSMTAADRLQGAASAWRHISSFGDALDRLSTGMLQAGFEGVTIPNKLRLANEGDTTAQALLKRLDPDWKVDKEYTPEQKSQLASNLIGHIHGTGDARTMPSWMLEDSEISGFFSLSHWGISQTDKFFHDIYKPATRGDIKPLVMSLFGSTIGGYVLKELYETIQGKKTQIPSLQEIASSSRSYEGNIGPIFHNIAAANLYAGFGGLLSQIVKVPLDALYKDSSQSLTFPLDEFATDITKSAIDMFSASQTDPNFNWFEAAKEYAIHNLSANIQLTRIAMNQAINAGIVDGKPAERKQLIDKLNQLRRFDVVEGYPVNEEDFGGNPFQNLESKKFKLTQNLGEAQQMLPSLIQNLFREYQDKPDVLKEKLKALKQNSWPTMPSPETMSPSFFKYISYLTKLKGPEEAQREFFDYAQHKAINQAKSSMVP